LKDHERSPLQLLNNFDIPKGAAREHKKDEHGNTLADYTLWTAASGLKAKRYYFRTYDNSQIRVVDLAKMNLDSTAIVTTSMKGSEVIQPTSPETKIGSAKSTIDQNSESASTR